MQFVKFYRNLELSNAASGVGCSKRPGVLDKLAAERVKLLEQESAELEQQAVKLEDEIKELSGEAAGRIA